MDYETPDGSQFSLREIWDQDNEEPTFAYTSVTAFVEGKVYAGKLEKGIEQIEDEEILQCLEPVPPECIHPPFPQGFLEAPVFNEKEHYLKAASYTWEDCQPGKTFVADCFLNETSVFEQLRHSPHPNLAKYFGTVVKDGRITQLCLQKYECALTQYVEKHEVSATRYLLAIV
jgi:hypothetical protein